MEWIKETLLCVCRKRKRTLFTWINHILRHVSILLSMWSSSSSFIYLRNHPWNYIRFISSVSSEQFWCTVFKNDLEDVPERWISLENVFCSHKRFTEICKFCLMRSKPFKDLNTDWCRNLFQDHGCNHRAVMSPRSELRHCFSKHECGSMCAALDGC